MRRQHYITYQHLCCRGRRKGTVRFHVGTPEGTRTLPYRSTSGCRDRVRSPQGGPYWYITLPYRLRFEGRTGAPSARPPRTSLRHGWGRRTNPPRVPLNVPFRELPSAAGLLSPLLYCKHGQAPVGTGWGRHTKVARLSRWARHRTQVFLTPECAMIRTRTINPRGSCKWPGGCRPW